MPDLSSLSRADASVIEGLCSLAAIEIGRQIDACEFIIARARRDSPWQVDHKAERERLKRQLHDAFAMKAAARRRRLKRLTAEEHAELVAGRDAREAA